jgi:DNA polymerase-3 subunit delta
VKLGAGQAAAAFDKPDSRIRFYLFSGVDQSMSRLWAQRLQKALGAEKVAVTGAQLKSDPRWLADEAASVSMFGDKRLLWVEPAGEEIGAAVSALLDAPGVEAPAVAITSSALKKDSNLKKLVEAHAAALHLASEPLSSREQAAQVMELGRAEGLRVPPQLAERVAEEANGDLILARLELQKFALYLDASPGAPKDLDEDAVDALGIDQGEADHSRPGDLALAGDLPALSDELVLLGVSGIDPIPVVRALQRRLLMLAPLRARVEQGQRPDSVVQSVWKRDKAMVSRILPRWTAARLAEAFVRVQRLERELLLQPVPGSAALGQTLFQLARAARR